MAKIARSARGQVVDFDVLAIKQQLASKPVPVGAAARRKFIDEKDGIKRRENYIVAPSAPAPAPVEEGSLPSALSIAAEAAEASAAAAHKPKPKHTHKDPT
jgi:hypothetical protein